ncbi:MAG: hypothetical protein E6640_03300 [Actinomyces urogenitalis]|mgnify:CR=1 FL=1|uniref:hypothetical protein n=1 Tax=Actinomyces urogenitalis TaxID=103621 RepID=UPI00290F1872|nr:hypothetical protein [Actinomyces urogenitalis]MDU6151233.1 hypothetical protein [Actinomyces urogenitalis]
MGDKSKTHAKRKAEIAKLRTQVKDLRSAQRQTAHALDELCEVVSALNSLTHKEFQGLATGYDEVLNILERLEDANVDTRTITEQRLRITESRERLDERSAWTTRMTEHLGTLIGAVLKTL